MTQIAAFRALRFNPAVAGETASLVAPPYDVISPEQREQLAQRSEHNIVHLDLPLPVPGETDKYAAAAALLNQWLAAGAVKAEDAPAVYIYGQVFTVDGQTFDRRGLMVRIRLPRPGETTVHQHEKTFEGPKADRLNLTRATRCNISPVFSLYPDEGNEVMSALTPAVAEAPDVDVIDADGVRHRLWVVSDEAAIAKAAELMASRDLFIADGHHRFNTAVNYRNELLESGSPLPSDHPANYVLMQIVSMSDPGLAILPTHRVVRGLVDGAAGKLLESLATEFDVTETAGELPTVAEGQIGLIVAGKPGGWVLTPRGDVLAARMPDRSADWRKLDVAVLHGGILENLLTPLLAGDQVEIKYVHEATEAAAALTGEDYQLAFIMAPTPLAALRQLAATGELMPQKSTYFFPKLATGLVINPLYDV